ncbi:MAG: NAD-dependent epimerase/dehydratase family protein [bacterium]
MNILITGGLGYIGGRIAHYLKEKAPDSHIFLTTSERERRPPLWTDKFTIVQMNLLDEDSIVNCLENKNIDVIIHLAAVNEIDSMKNPELAFEVNTQGTYRLLYVANENRIKRFIYFSTFHVYGEISGSVITEETPTKPFHPYAITHRAAEDFVAFFNHYHKIRTLIFRLSNGYGYPMDKDINRWTLVFNDLCRQAITSGRIVLKSSGKQHRDFIPLQDVVRAVYHFLFAVPDNWGDGLYNLGGNCSMSILDVAKNISNVYKTKYNKDILEIKTGQNNSDSIIPEPVKYNIEKIAKTGFTLKGDMFSEIEKTMLVCEGFAK